MDALTDPTDPSIFCVGFEAKGNTTIRPTDRRVVFADYDEGGGVLEFTPDMINVNLKGEWIYPDDPYANDSLLLPTPCDDTGLGEILLSPIDGRLWYACGGAWFDPDGVAVWMSESAHGVAITADGRLVVHEPKFASALFLVTPGERPWAPPELPRTVEAVVTGRVHDDGLWLVVVNGFRLFRWNLVGDTIVEEGEYSATNVNIYFAHHHNGVIDSEGDYSTSHRHRATARTT